MRTSRCTARREPRAPCLARVLLGLGMHIARVTSAEHAKAPPRTPLQTETVQKACRLAGGVSKLAKYLHVPATLVSRWVNGDERPPMRAFRDCVDLILFHERHFEGPEYGSKRNMAA
jgi:hypothetical protein